MISADFDPLDFIDCLKVATVFSALLCYAPTLIFLGIDNLVLFSSCLEASFPALAVTCSLLDKVQAVMAFSLLIKIMLLTGRQCWRICLLCKRERVKIPQLLLSQ